MTKRILTKELPGRVGERVHLGGWMHTLRRMGGVTFLVIRDRCGLAQAVLDDAAPLDGCQPETVLALTGTICAEPRARGGVELRDLSVEIISPVREALPFELNKGPLKANLSTFLDHASVGLRHPAKQATFRLASAILDAFGAWMRAHGFTQITTPKIVGAATEGGANMFGIEYFDRRAYLAQSPQLYKQVMVGVFERVFEIGHAYRAEPHDTARHLNEYLSLDMEMGFIEDHHDVMRVLSEVLRHILGTLAQDYAPDLAMLGARLPDLGDVPVISFTEAQDLLATRYGEEPDQADLSPSQERSLCRWAEAEHGSEWVFVTGYPTAHRPFYTMPDSAHPEQSNSFDLLCRGTELVTGGQRIHEYGQLRSSLRARGYDEAGFEGYLEAFRYGMPPEGGFAIGSERLLARFLGVENVREVTLFPRAVNRLTP